jgi:hypothetical protein
VARCYVAQCIEEDRAKGISICPMAQEFAAGRRSPYASLPAVDSQRRQKVSVYGTVGCATCRNREGSRCTVHFGDLSYAWRNRCNRGQSWRPLRRAVIAKLAGDFFGMIAAKARSSS